MATAYGIAGRLQPCVPTCSPRIANLHPVHNLQRRSVVVSAVSMLQRVIEEAEATNRARTASHSTASTSSPDDASGPKPRLPKLPRTRTGLAMLKVTGETRTKAAASQLTFALREDRVAIVHAFGARGMLMALRVLALGNQFVLQHNSAMTFCFSSVQQHLVEKAKQEEREAVEAGLGRFKPEPTDSITHYTLLVWLRKASTLEQSPAKNNQLPMYDFSLDARQNWKNKTLISMDVAYSIADHIYGSLQQPTPNGHAKTVLVSADTVQANLFFTALGLVQDRLKQENSINKVWCSVSRNSADTRADGRNGYIFRVTMRPLTPTITQYITTAQKNNAGSSYSTNGYRGSTHAESEA